MEEAQVRSPGREPPQRRAQQRTPGFLPGDSRGQRSLGGCSPQGRRIGRDQSECTCAWTPSCHRRSVFRCFIYIPSSVNDLYFIPKSCLVLSPKHICSPFVCLCTFYPGFPSWPWWWRTCLPPQGMRDAGSTCGSGSSPEEGTSMHSRIPTWRLPWAEEPGGLACTGSQSQTRVKQRSMHLLP